MNPEPSTTNKLNIVERRNGVNLTNETIFDPTSASATWRLKYGTGSEQRVETRGVVISTGGGATNRVETVDVRYAGAATPAYLATETYALLPWGFELSQVSIDPDNNPGTANSLITSFTYNTDPGAAHSYGQPDTVIYPDGFWEKRIYDDWAWPWYSMLKYVLRPDRDGPADPNDAEIENSIVTYYPPSEYGIGQEVYTYYKSDLWSPEKHWFREDLMYRIPWGWGLDASYTGADVNEDDTVPVGDSAITFDESWGFGYFGHTAGSFDDATTYKSAYVNGGTYDPVTKTFTISENDVWEGPDFRTSTIQYGQLDYRTFEEYPEEFTISEVDGQPLFDTWGGTPFMSPYRCWRDSSIFHAGSVVQRERHIFTGIDGGEPQFDLVEKWVYQNDSLGHATNVVRIDGATGVSRTVYSADYRGTNAYDGSLLLWEMDEAGVRTFFTYDSQKRLVKQTKEGVSAAGGFSSQSAITNTVSYDAYQRALTNTITASGLSLTTSIVYDIAGRPTSQTDTNGLTTMLAYDLGGRKTTATLPTTSTVITENYLDRRLKSITGTAVVAEYHDWNFTDDRESPLMGRVVTLHTIRYGSPTSPRMRTEGIDWVGRVIRWETPDPYETNSIITFDRYYGSHRKQSDGRWEMLPGGAACLEVLGFDYDGTKNTTYTPLIPGEGGWADSNNRLAHTDKAFAKIGGHWFECITNSVYRTHGDATPTITGITLNRQNGFANGSILSEVTTYDADTNVTVVTEFVDRAAKMVTTVMNPAQSTLNATNIVINGLLQLESTPTVSSPTRYYYDALGRSTSLLSPLGYTAYTSYNQSGQIGSATDFTCQTTTYEYYPNGQTGAGQVKSVTTGGKKTYSSYTARGELTRSWGDVPYPEERVYTDYGELGQLRAYRGGSGWNDANWPGSPGSYDQTTWTYQDWSGLLLGKTDAANKTVSYTYDHKLLKTRTWARGNTVTNLYNNLGELVGMDYSDGTHAISFLNSEFPDLSRTARPLTVFDDSGAWMLGYDHADRLVYAACTNGLLNGITLSNHFNGLYGRDRIQVLGTSPLLTNDYRYEATYGRMSVVSNGIYSATYDYLPNSDLLQTTTFKNNGTTKLTTTRSWENGSRLGAILNQVGSTTVSSHGYQYDSLNRRTRASLEDGSYWQYDYNDRNELTGARHYWPDMYPVSGQHFGYDYDNIGNRESASSGGDVNGWNLRTTSYEVNNLNQYTAITTPGYKDIMGAALATNTVTVNTGTADRKVEYFHREISVANSSSPVWQDVTVSSGGVSSNGGFVCPKNNQALTYDLDGNLTFDGVWTYEWDGENRLKAMTMTNVSAIPNAQRKRLEFAYDYMNRRVQKVVSTWSGSSFTSPVTNQFVYDGWNLLAELDTSHSALRSYLWGQDLSGTMSDAGGIGGLLMVAYHVPATDTYHFAAYDGNGNVTALVNASDQSTSARYEYSPYGQLQCSTGPLAALNPFRWSTKCWDEESGLVYYGYRYYHPSSGRWIGRDPSEEDGGINLYAALQNSPISQVDSDGRSIIQWVRPVLLAASQYLWMIKTGRAVGTANTLWLQQTRAIAAQGIKMTLGGSAVGPGGTGAGFGGPPKNFYKYSGTGWALSLTAASLFATYGTVYAAANLALGQRSAAGSAMYSVESGILNSINGEAAYADLDFIEAALIATGGSASAALVAWDTFDEGAKMVAEAFAGTP